MQVSAKYLNSMIIDKFQNNLKSFWYRFNILKLSSFLRIILSQYILLSFCFVAFSQVTIPLLRDSSTEKVDIAQNYEVVHSTYHNHNSALNLIGIIETETELTEEKEVNSESKNYITSTTDTNLNEYYKYTSNQKSLVEYIINVQNYNTISLNILHQNLKIFLA